jgi:hypothetical protein
LCSYPRLHDLSRWGFADEIRGACGKAGNLGSYVDVIRDEYDRHLRQQRFGLHSGAEFEAVHGRHLSVNQHDIRRRFLRQPKPFGP